MNLWAQLAVYGGIALACCALALTGASAVMLAVMAWSALSRWVRRGVE